jgi:hypothetical protein
MLLWSKFLVAMAVLPAAISLTIVREPDFSGRKQPRSRIKSVSDTITGSKIKREIINGGADATSPSLAIIDLSKRDECNNQNIQGSDNIQTCGNDTSVVTNNNESSNVSKSHGLSRTDQIAIGVGVGGGVVTLAGVILTYIGIRRAKGSKRTSNSHRPRRSQQSVLQVSQPQVGFRSDGRYELGS